MPDIRNPWARPPEEAWQSAPSPASPPGRATRWSFGACAVVMAIGAPAQVMDDLGLLLDTSPAVARVLAREEPRGSPEPLFLHHPLLPSQAHMERVGLRFTTAQGQEVTFAVARTPRPWQSFQPGAEVPVRYDPADPTARPVVRGTGEIWGSVVTTLLAIWIVLPAMIRTARGAPSVWRAAWPPWPFRR